MARTGLLSQAMRNGAYGPILREQKDPIWHEPLIRSAHDGIHQSLPFHEYTLWVYHSIVIRTVRLSRRAEKDLTRVPGHIGLKLQAWIESVQCDGLEVVRRIPGYHDELLLGDWRGYRSIRLSKAYRAIYRIAADRDLELVNVERVNKHEY